MKVRFVTTCVAAVLAATFAVGAQEKAAGQDEKAPETFKVKFDASTGPFVVQVHRAWAPNAADHFYTLVKNGFYDDARFFRVVRNFVVQFGVSGDPQTNRLWSSVSLPDDPVTQHNSRGTITFATRGPNTRTSSTPRWIS